MLFHSFFQALVNVFRNVTTVVLAVFMSGLISHRLKTDLVILNGNINARRYIDMVLHPVVLPFLKYKSDKRKL